MKSLLIVQHEDDTPAGTTLDWAHLRNLKVHFWRPALEAAPPETDECVGVVICGGSMDTHQEEKFPWLKTEKIQIQKWLKEKTKIFGLCLGSQLLAEALGGSVHQHKGWEIGFIPIKDLQGNTIPVFHWHRYTFTPPPGADLVLKGDYCLNQAFRWGQQVMATQFHPESSKEWILSLLKELEPHHTGNVQTASQIRADLPLQEDLQRWYFSELDHLFLINPANQTK